MALDTRGLVRTASTSEAGESFLTLAKWEGGRVGVGARAPEVFFVEVLISLFPDGEVDLDRIERALAQLRWLDASGYKLSCRDESAVCAEKSVTEMEAEREAAAALAAVGPSAKRRL